MIREFHLSPAGKGIGIACDVNGAFVGAIPILSRLRKSGKDVWQPRDCDELSNEIGEHYGLPIGMSVKRGGLRAIANALNDGDLARAQIATVLLGIPNPPQLSKGSRSRDQTIKLIRDLHWTGMLKWDPDEHPRWAAGSADSKGGQFAPKDEGDETSASFPSQPLGSADQTTSYDLETRRPSRSATAQLADAAISDASDDPVAEAAAGAVEAAQREQAVTGTENGALSLGFNAGSSATQVDTSDDLGIYDDYGDHIGGVQFAATTIPMGPIGITGANPSNWVNLKRLADGSLELGSGQIIAAATLLSAIDRSRERDAVRSAIAKFGLNPTQAADVLAARAYVWANTAAPWNFAGVPMSGPGLESVSRSIALLELARPGTLYLAWQGDRLSTDYLKAAAQEGLSDAAILESRRLANAPLALQSTSAAARAALKLKPGDNMQAHHLVPVNIVGRNLPLAKLASKAGWRTDSPDNLIALPGDLETQKDLEFTEGKNLPIQSSAHPMYDDQTQEQIEALKLLAGSPLTPTKARLILDEVATENRRQIISGEWQPMLKSTQT